MSPPTLAANRTIGFRSRLEARIAPLLEKRRRELASSGQPSVLERVTAESLALPVVSYVARLVDALVEGRPMQQAVLDRGWLAERWSLLDHDACEGEEQAALAEVIGTEHREGKQPKPPHWPGNVSRDNVIQALLQTRDPGAARMAEALRDGLAPAVDEDRSFGVETAPRPPHERPPPPASGQGGAGWSEQTERAARAWPILPCAKIIGAHKMVLDDLRKPAIAIDAGRTHHELMGGWSRAARDSKVVVDTRPDRVELFLPGAEHKPASLTLPLHDESLSQVFVEAIREWRSFLGLRHWIALQSLFSIQGKREGRVVWKLEDHLDALGVSKRWREDPDNRASVAREVSLLTKMQLVVYHPDGSVRARHNVLLTTAEIDVERGGQWMLEGLELQIHPWLYNGVRDQKTGQLGKHWHPAPPELAKVDHDKFRYALVLGLLLPMRWKWAWAKNGADHITLEASKLLELACIEVSAVNPGRAWDTLERNLEQLQLITLLGHVEWEGDPRMMASKIQLYPADWLLDRTVQGLRPVEKALPTALPATGAELVQWRKARGWTQLDLAQQLEVGLRTIKRDEIAKDKGLGRAISAALKALVTKPGRTPEPPGVESTSPGEGNLDG